MSPWTPERIVELRRGRYHETQPLFAQRLGVSIETLRWWEQEKGVPSGPAERLLDRLLEDAEADEIRPHPNEEARRSTRKQPVAAAS